jgi:hypothetical protein
MTTTVVAEGFERPAPRDMRVLATSDTTLVIDGVTQNGPGAA